MASQKDASLYLVVSVFAAIVGAVAATLIVQSFSPIQPLARIGLIGEIVVIFLLIIAYRISMATPTQEPNFMKRLLVHISRPVVEKNLWICGLLLAIVALPLGILVGWAVSPNLVVKGCRSAPIIELVSPPRVTIGRLEVFALKIARCKRIGTMVEAPPGSMRPASQWSDPEDEVKFWYESPSNSNAIQAWMKIDVQYYRNQPKKHARRVWWFSLGEQK